MYRFCVIDILNISQKTINMAITNQQISTSRRYEQVSNKIKLELGQKTPVEMSYVHKIIA